MRSRRAVAAGLLALAGAVALGSPAQAAPIQETNVTKCGAWRGAFYSAYQYRECLNVATYSNGQSRLTARTYGRRVGDAHGDWIRGQAVVRRGSGTRYASSWKYLTGSAKVNQQVMLGAVTHWYSSAHGTAVATAKIHGKFLASTSDPIVFDTSHSTSKAY